MFSQIVMWVHAACTFIDVWDSRDHEAVDENTSLNANLNVKDSGATLA